MRKIALFVMLSAIGFVAIAQGRKMEIYQNGEVTVAIPVAEIDSIKIVLPEEYVVTGVYVQHEYVDLGLPSGTKWATCNVGADCPEEYGGYYAWGELETKDLYSPFNSVTNQKDFDDISGNSAYDVARNKWGGAWRIPTEEDMLELKTKCAWTWTTKNDVVGHKVTGPNGNSIFLPAAGMIDTTSLYGDSSRGRYWSSTPCKSNTTIAYELSFTSTTCNMYSNYRLCGLTIRPVFR